MMLDAVMDDVGAALATLRGLRVFGYWVDRVVPPAAIVMWPDSFDYDETLARGADRVVLPVMVVVGRVELRSARDQLAQWAAGSGSTSVKAAVENHKPTAYDTARVESVEFGTVTIAGIELLSATFSIEIIGTGA